MSRNEFIVRLEAMGFKGFQGQDVLNSMNRYCRVIREDNGFVVIVSEILGIGKYVVDTIDEDKLDDIYDLYEFELSNPELANLSKEGWDNMTKFEQVELAEALGVLPAITVHDNVDGIDWMKPEDTIKKIQVIDSKIPDAPGQCPFCGSYNVDYGTMYPDGDVISYETHCCHCHKDWDEIYNISFSHNKKRSY